MTFASISVSMGNITLSGYLLDNGKVQFVMKGQMRTFDTIMDACQWWLNNVVVSA